jgi:S-adenosylmethionine:diacylglycerol 3-amino-3-carboxypropyl transferase
LSEIFFAQIREDPEVECAVAARRAPKQVVCVGSGGCVALSLLSDAVEAVHAVDLNPAQCAVIELKRAAIAELDRAAYLAFVGEAPADDRQATFARLAPRLSTQAREFWQARPELVAVGVNHAGVTERFYRYLGASIRASVVPDDVWHALFACATVEEQRALHARHFTSEAWRTAIRVLLSKSTHLLFFPAFMFANATEHDFGAFFSHQFDHEVLTKPVANNYFLSQLLWGRYLDGRAQGVPRYLDAARWDETRRNAHKLSVAAQPIGAFLAGRRGVDAFFLSNVFDWMKPEDRAELCARMTEAAAPGAAVLFRNMLSTPALPASFVERLRVDADESAALHRRERSMSYQRITSGALP